MASQPKKYTILILIILSCVLLLIVGIIVKSKIDSLYQSITPKATLVSDFPQLPIYPKAALIKSSSDLHEGETYNGVKYSATWEVNAKVPEVVKWYEAKLKDTGWTLDISPANPDAQDIQLLTFFNNTYTLNLSISKQQNSELTSITAEFSTRFSDTREPGEEEGE